MINKLIAPLLLWSAIMVCGACNSHTEPIDRKDRIEHQIDSLVQLYHDYDGFNGAVLVSHEGEVIYKKGFGMANMELKTPNTTATKFRIASMTKTFTAVLILQLVAEGKLELHTPISNYLPQFPKEQGMEITVHHLLTHSSGIPNNYEGNSMLNRFPDKHRPEGLVHQFWGLPLEFTPGDRFSYSNSGYNVLGYLLEEVSGMSFEQLLREKILNPLGMKNTGVERHRPLINNRAQGYFTSFGTTYNANYIDMSTVYAAGYIYSTVEDLHLWQSALYSEEIVPKQYLELMVEKHIYDSQEGGFYGYGWEIKHRHLGNSKATVETVGHGGAIDGFCSMLTVIPSSRSSIIFLNNTRRAYLNTMTTAITGILNQSTYDFPKKPLAKFMANVIKNEGIEAGIEYVKKHQNNPDFYLDETELIVEGYRLLHDGNAQHAAQVFELSIDVFPDRDNPYDSYAGAMMTMGNNEVAIEYYQKSLEINPNNKNAEAMLKRLKN
ncbi:MAG: serine hydrolase [Bacteroidota bacterium]